MASDTMTASGGTAQQRRGDLRNYLLGTGAYWTETLVDGATRTLVLFYFDRLGYSPLKVASLFVLYEIAGVVTNLVGGWLAARLGLKITLFMGLAIQIVALCMLGFAPASLLVVGYVMVSQALSGIAKDLTKMSSKSAVKLVVPENDQSSLYRWVAILTGSKNALKGVGFFLGGLLLTLVGFQAAMLIMAAIVLVALLASSSLMRGYLGAPDKTAKFTQMFSNNRAVNVLAAARIFLFASRDVWFVVALPFFLYSVVGWTFWQVGTLLAVWVIGYGAVQAAAPCFRPAGGRGPGPRPRRQDRDLAGARTGAVPRRDRAGPHRTCRPRDCDRHRADPLRRRVRDELRGPLLPDPRLRRQRQGRNECRLLLHGQRDRAPRRDGALGIDL
jgi:MFS family permease